MPFAATAREGASAPGGSSWWVELVGHGVLLRRSARLFLLEEIDDFLDLVSLA